jgi:hypothetical protein
VHEFIIERGAYPSPLGYSSFPKSCTTSVNNVIAREWVCCVWISSRAATDYSQMAYRTGEPPRPL